MDIKVSTTFWGPLYQNRFSLITRDEKSETTYTGFFEAGDWNFELVAEDEVFLESRRKDLPGRQAFLGRREYEIFRQGRKIGELKRSYLKKELWSDGFRCSFPGIFNPRLSHLGLNFPFRTWVSRREVQSRCQAEEPKLVMLSIAMTIYVWFTWNALPAD